MQTRSLGRCGLSVSEVGLGTWALASEIYGSVSSTEAKDTVRAALDAGITLFDTAPLYGNASTDGIAETRLADALGSDTHRVLISTKFGRYSSDGAAPNFHAQRARESVEGSLRRLRRETLDVLFFHSPFGLSDIHDDVWEELDRLKAEGKVRVIGHSISKFADTQEMCRTWAVERRIDAIQVVLSLMNRESRTLIQDLSQDGVGVFARESLANGFLTGALTADTVFPPGHLNHRYDRTEIQARAHYVASLRTHVITEDVTTVPQAAFRWVLDQPGVSLVLSGASCVEHLSDAVRASAAPSYGAATLAAVEALHTRDFEAA